MDGVNPRCEYCGKISFRSIHHAKEAAKTLGSRIRVYPCHGVFHITKAVKGMDVKRNRRKA